jgi:hypothetical protein
MKLLLNIVRQAVLASTSLESFRVTMSATSSIPVFVGTEHYALAVLKAVFFGDAPSLAASTHALSDFK